MRRPANIFFLAILIGVLSAAMVYRYLRVQQAELEAARESARGLAVDIVVAKEIIPIGARIDAQQVKTVRWPTDARPQGGFTDPSGVIGHTARVTIQRNQPIEGAHLTTDTVGLLPLIIDEGMRAMSVKVDKVTGVSGFITPNSRVDVLVASDVQDGNGQGGSGSEQRSKVVIQNVKVLAIGTTIEQVDDKPVEVPTVTLLVSPDQAERLTLATRQQSVQLALRNYRDTEDIATRGVTLKQLFGLDGSLAQAGKVKLPPPPPAPPSVEVLLGETRTRQLY
jgi:pilus assembly protein CpaB